MVSSDILEKLEAGYSQLQATTSNQCSSLLKKYLTRDVLDNLKHRETSNGASLLDVVQSGFANLDSTIGLYAPDADAYAVFAELFDPIVDEYHLGFNSTDLHPPLEFGHPDDFVDFDPLGRYVISTRIRCARNIRGYPFTPCLSDQQYGDIEHVAVEALNELEGDLAGTYYPLSNMSMECQKQLAEDHFLFGSDDRFMKAANSCRHWPLGRGIYHNDDKTFLVWLNEEDELRIISMERGGDLRSVYSRFIRGVHGIGSKVDFAHDNRLGFLSSCPSNLGTAMRASVHIKLPLLSSNLGQLERVALQNNLQVRGTDGEHSETVGGVYDISNIRRLGVTEYEVLREMQSGILALIQMEQALERTEKNRWVMNFWQSSERSTGGYGDARGHVSEQFA